MEDFKDCEEFEIRSKQSDISTTKQVEKYAKSKLKTEAKTKKWNKELR